MNMMKKTFSLHDVFALSEESEDYIHACGKIEHDLITDTLMYV